jgi:hypothetical protein
MVAGGLGAGSGGATLRRSLLDGCELRVIAEPALPAAEEALALTLARKDGVEVAAIHA